MRRDLGFDVHFRRAVLHYVTDYAIRFKILRKLDNVGVTSRRTLIIGLTECLSRCGFQERLHRVVIVHDVV